MPVAQLIGMNWPFLLSKPKSSGKLSQSPIWSKHGSKWIQAEKYPKKYPQCNLLLLVKKLSFALQKLLSYEHKPLTYMPMKKHKPAFADELA